MSTFGEWIGRTFSLRGGLLAAFFDGGSSKAGKTVTVDSALQLSAAWACVRLISQTIATLPISVYERQDGGRRKVATSHPLAQVLRQPNAEQTPVEFVEGLVACLCLRGNFLGRKLENGQKDLIGIDTMHPDSVTVTRENRARVWRWRDPDGQVHILSDAQVFHVKGFGMGGELGLSPIRYARETFGAALAADEAAARLFGNGMQSSGVFTVDQELKDSQRAQMQKVLGEFVGSKSSGKAMILEAGVKYSALNFNPEEAQLLGTRAFNVEEICRWFGVPPILVGHASAGQTMWGSGVEQIFLGWLALGLRPYLVRIEQAINRRLLTPEDRLKYYVEFNVEGLLRADAAGRAALYSSGSQNGWLYRAEIRERENLPPADDDNADKLTVQSNLVRLEDLGQSAPASETVRSALKDWLLDEKDDAA